MQSSHLLDLVLERPLYHHYSLSNQKFITIGCGFRLLVQPGWLYVASARYGSARDRGASFHAGYRIACVRRRYMPSSGPTPMSAPAAVRTFARCRLQADL